MIDFSLVPNMPLPSYLDDSASIATSSTGFSLDLERVAEVGEMEPAGRCVRCRRWLRRPFLGVVAMLRVLMQPALAATLVGIIAGLLDTPRILLFEEVSSPLRPLGRTIHSLGQPGPLIGALIMSASLAGSFRDKRRADEAEMRISPEHGSPKRQTSAHPPNNKSTPEGSTLTGTITLIPLFVRSILSPATGFLLVYGCTRLHQTGGALGEIAAVALPPGLPWLHLTVVLQWSSAPAQTIVVACARLGLDSVAGALSRMYLPLYMMAIVSVTVSSSLSLSFFF